MRADIARKLRGIMKLRRALLLVWQSVPGWTAAGICLIIVQGMLPLAALYLMKLIVDGVTGSITSADRIRAFTDVALLIFCAGAVGLATVLCRSLAEIVRETQGRTVTDHIADVIHAKSVEVDIEYYDNPDYHDTLHRAQQEAPYRPTRIVNSLTQLFQGGLSLCAVAGLLIYLHWAIALILFVALVPGVFVRLKYADRMYQWHHDRAKTERKADYFHWMLIDDSHAKEIRLFGLGPLFIEWHRNLSARLRREKLSISTRRALFELLTQTCGILALFGSFAFIAHRTLAGAMTVGDMVMYYQAFQRAQGCLQEVMSSLACLYEDNLFLSHFYEFLDLKPKVASPQSPVAFPETMEKGIVFSKVGFRYPGNPKPVLKDIDLRIAPGQVVALVGENGSGKTTLVKLLCRLYDPASGTIALEGIDLRQFDVCVLRKHFSVIFQDYVHYHLTARENIWLGNIEADPGDEKIRAAAEQTGVMRAVNRLQKGFDTQLGCLFEDGEELSIGEWQKIALARAFYSNAGFIILDEPTSSMDAKAEHEVFTTFRKLLHGRTAVLISHRFSTVKMADYIYVLDQGSILEHGTHDSLIGRGGKYARLFDMQAQHYR